MEMLHGKICTRENLYTGKFVYGKESGTVFGRKRVKKHTSYALQKGRFPGKRVFLGGNVFPRKRGLESVWCKCFKQIRVSDNVSFIHNHLAMSTYTIEMLLGNICIRENLYTGKNQEQYIAVKG